MSLAAAARMQPRERTLDASLVRVPGMAHALTDEPGLESAPKRPPRPPLMKPSRAG
jgi:hypothetical protein